MLHTPSTHPLLTLHDSRVAISAGGGGPWSTTGAWGFGVWGSGTQRAPRALHRKTPRGGGARASRTRILFAMFHVLTAACPAVSRSRNAISATVCSRCELHAEPRAVPEVEEGALAVVVPQRWVLVWTRNSALRSCQREGGPKGGEEEKG